VDCIYQWLRKNKLCPLCKEDTGKSVIPGHRLAANLSEADLEDLNEDFDEEDYQLRIRAHQSRGTRGTLLSSIADHL
jgi:hypothetical protein